MDNRLNLAPCSPKDLRQPLADLLSGAKIVRLEGPSCAHAHWVVAGRLEKRALMSRGVPFELVWTLSELESAGVELTLSAVIPALEGE